jgi:hypothetical protein
MTATRVNRLREGGGHSKYTPNGFNVNQCMTTRRAVQKDDSAKDVDSGALLTRPNQKISGDGVRDSDVETRAGGDDDVGYEAQNDIAMAACGRGIEARHGATGVLYGLLLTQRARTR